MVFKDQELLSEAYTKVLQEAMDCKWAKKGCKCNGGCKDCKSNQKKKNVKEGLDNVGKEDKDINNDGKTDSSDEYLKKRREAIAKAQGKDEEEEPSEKNESLREPVKLKFKDLYSAVISKHQ